MGSNDENGARHGYAADAPFIDSPRDALIPLLAKRFIYPTKLRLFEQAIRQRQHEIQRYGFCRTWW